MRVGKPEPHAPGKDFDVGGLHVQRTRWYARSCPSSPAESSETVNDSGDGDGTTRTAVCNLDVPSHNAHTWKGARKVVRKAGNNGFEVTDSCA